MREVEVRLRGWKLADALGELRIWLDHNQCTLDNFEIAADGDALVVRVIFAEDDSADRFQREFGRR
jgi:hypothetical protein